MVSRVARLAAIMQLVLRRARTRPGRGALVAAGIAIACALVAGLAGGSLAARDRALQKTIAALPESQRSVRVGWAGVSPGTGFAQIDREARGVLRPLGGSVSRSVAFRSLHLHGGLVQLAGVDSLARIVHLTSGRLPRTCTPTRCEVVALSGHPPSRLDAIGIHMRVVGRGTLTSSLALGDVLVHEPGEPAVPVVATSGVAALTSLPALSALFRGYSWAVPLNPRSLHVWNIDDVLARIASSESTLQLRDNAFGVDAPVQAVLDARDSGRAAARRILLVGGEAAALVLAFAVLAAAGLRRDVEAERRRLEQHGATRGQSALLAISESCLAALLGTVAGLFVGLARDRRDRRSDRTCPPARLPGTRSDRRSRWRSSPAAGSRLPDSSPAGCSSPRPTTRTAPGSPRSTSQRSRAPSRSCSPSCVGLPPSTSCSSGQGAGIILLALPALVALATGVALARLLGPLTRLAERAGRGTGAAPRLALLALARGRGRTSATAAFLAVSTGLAVFAVVYGATLSEGDRDQAAFRVPLDFTASQGTSLTRPLGAASLADWRRLAPGAVALPVLRLSADVLQRDGSLRLARPDRRARRRAAEAPLDRSRRSRPLPGGRCGEARTGRLAGPSRPPAPG